MPWNARADSDRVVSKVKGRVGKCRLGSVISRWHWYLLQPIQPRFLSSVTLGDS